MRVYVNMVLYAEDCFYIIEVHFSNKKLFKELKRLFRGKSGEEEVSCSHDSKTMRYLTQQITTE